MSLKKRNLIPLLGLALFTLTAAGCDLTLSFGANGALLGTWTSLSGNRYTFNADGTYQYTVASAYTEKGIYARFGDTLNLRRTHTWNSFYWLDNPAPTVEYRLIVGSGYISLGDAYGTNYVSYYR